jgi:hypothetical protein
MKNNLMKKLNPPVINQKLKSLFESNFSDKEIGAYIELIQKIIDIRDQLSFGFFIDNTFNNKSFDTKFITTELINSLIRKSMIIDNYRNSEKKEPTYTPSFERIPKEYISEDAVLKEIKSNIERFS